MAYWVKTEFSGIVDLEKAYLVKFVARDDKIEAWFEGVSGEVLITGKNTAKVFDGFCRSHAIDSSEDDN